MDIEFRHNIIQLVLIPMLRVVSKSYAIEFFKKNIRSVMDLVQRPPLRRGTDVEVSTTDGLNV